jgi:hypothetical protein
MGEIGAVPRHVARQDAIAADGGVGADVEVRQRQCLGSAPPIGEKRLAGEKCRFEGNRLAFEGPWRRGFILSNRVDISPPMTGLMNIRESLAARSRAALDQDSQ